MSTLFQSRALLLSIFFLATSADFYRDTQVTWGEGRAKILKGGRVMSLSLDHYSGSGFQSKNEHLFGRFDMQLKLVPGNSAGTGKGDKEQQFRLWFDPTSSFHAYSIVWNSQRIIFLVDNIPIRVLKNDEAIGTPFPTRQPMRVYCSLWDAEDWATQGGRVKTDWTKVPFVATYRDFIVHGCVAGTPCSGDSFNGQAWRSLELGADGRKRMHWVKRKYMIYNYCSDSQRFPKGIPVECMSTRV